MRRLRDAGVECAAIDLSAGGVQNVTPEQWYVDLIDNLIESFDLDVDLAQWWAKNKLYSEVTRFRKFIEEVLLVEVQENIVIFIDEIDSVLSLKFPTDDFFALIRAFHNQRVDNSDYNRLTFCLLGVASEFVDESRLLRGNALKDAEEWGKNKNLSYQDKQFLAASREKEIQEEIAAQEKEAQLERERKDREATEERNLLLTEANIKAKRQIRSGYAVLLLALFIAGILGVFAAREGHKALQAQEMLKKANTEAKEANKNVEDAKMKAEEEGKKVIAFQKRTQKLQKTADVATILAKKAAENAKNAQENASNANQKATVAGEKAQNAERKVIVANQKAVEAEKLAGVEQEKAQQAQQNVKDANEQAARAKQLAQVEQDKAKESQKIEPTILLKNILTKLTPLKIIKLLLLKISN
jgi:chemotaxis protein histidine kinase CheA